MKEWCLQHPWMTFFILIFMICIFFDNNFTVIRGNKKFMENLSTKGVIKMSDNNENGKRNDTSKPSERRSTYENGCHSVPPSKESAPKPPGRQK